MYITSQGPRLRNDLYCVEWDVKLLYTIPYPQLGERLICDNERSSVDNGVATTTVLL